MFSRDKVCQLAVKGWLIAALVVLPCTSTAQQETEEPPAALEQSQETAVEAPAPKSETPKPTAQQETPATQPPPAAPVQSERPAEKPCGPHCQAAEQREKDDLEAQRSMAEAAFNLVVISWWQFGVGTIGISLLLVTLWYTRKSTRAATAAADAAQAAVKEAQRQADAAILLEAAKFTLTETYLCSPGGGPIQNFGIPENGFVPIVKFKNIGKTPAFVTSHRVIWKISEAPPSERYPMSSIKVFPPSKTVSSGGTIRIKGTVETISIDEETAKAIGKGTMFLWAFGKLCFRDWFGIDREEPFLLRWEPKRRPGVEYGFHTHPRPSKAADHT